MHGRTLLQKSCSKRDAPVVSGVELGLYLLTQLAAKERCAAWLGFQLAGFVKTTASSCLPVTLLSIWQ